MSPAQEALFKWAKFYRGIYEMMPTERPEDAIINDDAALDAWYQRYTREIAMRAAKLKGKPTGGAGFNVAHAHKLHTDVSFQGPADS